MLDLFERVRRQYPTMANFRRYKDEVALESAPDAAPGCWASVRGRSVRSGVLNPDNAEQAYGLHASVLQIAPFYLSISPLDVDHIELLYGFDLQAGGNHDEIVADALFGQSPLARLLDVPNARTSDCQPIFGMTIGEPGEFEIYYEVKTRPSPDGPDSRASSSGSSSSGEPGGEPISVYLTLRRYGPINTVDELPEMLRDLAQHGEELVETRVAPLLLQPIREAIASGNA